MAFNRFMHPRNPYKDHPPSFKELAEQYPELAQYMVENTQEETVKESGKSSAKLNFSEPAALRALTCALLHRDFNLKIEIPLNKLIPTVPSRLNYLLWVQDLIAGANSIDAQDNHAARKVTGLDVGTGASCIYPLLGCRFNPTWFFIATEYDREALEYGRANVERNDLNERIKVLEANLSGHLSYPVDATNIAFDFSMCNPPFFESAAEREEKASYKPPKHASNPIAESDAVTQGGEVAFVTKMIDESILLRDKIRIYTSLLGKKSSLAPLKKLLHSRSTSFITTEFCQGRTMRWGLAWSLCIDLTGAAFKDVGSHFHVEKPLTYTHDFGPVSETQRMSICLKTIELLEKDLKMDVASSRFGKERSTWLVSATSNLWSNQRRKRRADLHANGREKNGTERDVGDGMDQSATSGSSSARQSFSPESEDLIHASEKNDVIINFSLTFKSAELSYLYELSWISGQNREHLNQIHVFLINKLTAASGAVLEANLSGHLSYPVDATNIAFDFSMCNPPFFESAAEREEKASYKPPKHASNPIAESDAVTQGGEVAFVTKMIDESILLRDKIRIYTSLLGKKSSLAPLKKLLHSRSTSFITTEFCQGRTMRWGLAWSLCIDLTGAAFKDVGSHFHVEKPLTYTHDFGPVSETQRMSICLKTIELLEKDLKMDVASSRFGKERSTWLVSATSNLWSNQRRKRRADLHANGREKNGTERDVGDGMDQSATSGSSSARQSFSPESEDLIHASEKNDVIINFSLTFKSAELSYLYELSWISGQNREHLNQIHVFLINKLTAASGAALRCHRSSHGEQDGNLHRP